MTVILPFNNSLAPIPQASPHKYRECEHKMASEGSLLSKGHFPTSSFLNTCVPSHGLMISSGCVTVDPTTRQVAILHDPSTGIVQLPKGRKNIGEDLHANALRETYEELGISVTALPLKIATRATPTSDMLHLVHKNEDGYPADVTTEVTSCEPSAVCYFQCAMTLAFKLVFFYAAKADSSIEPVDGTKEPWEEQYLLEWVDAKHAAGRMSFKADAEVVDKVLDDMRASGYDI